MHVSQTRHLVQRCLYQVCWLQLPGSHRVVVVCHQIDNSAGRTIGRVVSEETKEKLRIANTGKTMSDEAKKKMSESHKGIIPSDETRKKMSSWQKGKIVSEETKAKLRGPMKKGCNEETLRRQKVKGTGKKRGPYKKVIK